MISGVSYRLGSFGRHGIRGLDFFFLRSATHDVNGIKDVVDMVGEERFMAFYSVLPIILYFVFSIVSSLPSPSLDLFDRY